MVSRRWIIVGLVLAAPFAAPVALRAEPVVVHTRTGRVLTGDVDAQTTPSRLWLRLAERNIVAFSSVDWSDVTRVESQGRSYSVDEYRPQAARQKSPVPAGVFVKPVAQAVEGGRDAERKNVIPRVRSLRIDAEVASWDSDAEVDGFEVRVSPLASDRTVVPVSGILSVQLFGQNITPDQMFEPIRSDYVRLEQWSQRVAADDFGPHEVLVRLPFQRIHPEFYVDVRNYGQLNASFSVQGQGVYDATIPVNLRAYSPVRERLQLYRRYRFFPGERTGVFHAPHLGIFPGDVIGR